MRVPPVTPPPARAHPEAYPHTRVPTLVYACTYTHHGYAVPHAPQTQTRKRIRIRQTTEPQPLASAPCHIHRKAYTPITHPSAHIRLQVSPIYIPVYACIHACEAHFCRFAAGKTLHPQNFFSFPAAYIFRPILCITAILHRKNAALYRKNLHGIWISAPTPPYICSGFRQSACHKHTQTHIHT